MPSGGAILDASCGIGIDAIVLARMGYEVTGTDASPAMLREARSRARVAGVEVCLLLADWRELSQELDPGAFDAILCTGNSIAHLGKQEMVVALGEFASLLVPGGELIVDTHRWEQVLASGDRVLRDPERIERNGLVCERFYCWTIGDASIGDECHLEFRLEISSGDTRDIRSHGVTFDTYTVSEFLQRFREAGLRVLYCDAESDSDRYTVVAGRS